MERSTQTSGAMFKDMTLSVIEGAFPRENPQAHQPHDFGGAVDICGMLCTIENDVIFAAASEVGSHGCKERCGEVFIDARLPSCLREGVDHQIAAVAGAQSDVSLGHVSVESILLLGKAQTGLTRHPVYDFICDPDKCVNISHMTPMPCSEQAGG
ncbi:hypothetical protein GCM10010401_21040 [Rarobacter faecitabidus]